MKYLPIVFSNLRRHKLRTLLTIASVALALFLFAMLRTVVTTLGSVAAASSASRMVVQNATGFVIPLPTSYAARLSTIPHVNTVTWANWFGGKYGDNKNDFFSQFAIDPASYLTIYPEMSISADEKEAFLKERTAALVGEGLVQKYGWKVGDNVTLQGTIFPGDWTFTIRAVYHPTTKGIDKNSLFFHYDYLYEREPTRVTPGWFTLEIDDVGAAATVAKTVDDQFRNSSAPTKTGTEAQFTAGFASMYGNIGLLMSTIGFAVVFAILLVTANAMMMNQRERTAEVAVMKTVGFTDGLVFGLVLVEAAIISLIGSGIGLGAAKALTGSGDMLASFLPGFIVADSTLLIGLGVALFLTIASGVFPAWQAAKLPVVQALRRVE